MDTATKLALGVAVFQGAAAWVQAYYARKSFLGGAGMTTPERIPLWRRFWFSQIMTVVIVSCLIGYSIYDHHEPSIVAREVAIEAAPTKPWLHTPADRPEYKDFSIRPSVTAKHVLTSVDATLLEIYRFHNGGWGESLNSDVSAPVAWFSSEAFQPQTLHADTKSFLAPLQLDVTGHHMNFVVPSNRAMVPEISRWVNDMMPGRYKLRMAITANGLSPVIFNLIVEWYGSADTINYNIEQ